jgi:hypothetical protein
MYISPWHAYRHLTENSPTSFPFQQKCIYMCLDICISCPVCGAYVFGISDNPVREVFGVVGIFISALSVTFPFTKLCYPITRSWRKIFIIHTDKRMDGLTKSRFLR